MAGLSDLTQTSETSTTTLPSWYNTAQQNLLSGATNAASTAPQLGQTVAQGAINTLQQPNNPFSQATNTLGSIATGAANPWITDPTTGSVTPNTNTAMGGLFAAQRDQLNQMLPTLTAGTEAGAIGSGNFGSLRGQTAVDTAKGNAMTTLAAQQMASALQNQSTGVNAGIGQSNAANQEIANQMNVGQAQMTAPFTNAANYGNILASMSAPQTVTRTSDPSTLQNLTGLGSMVSGGLNALLPSSVIDKNGKAINNPGLLGNLGTLGSKFYNTLFGPSAASVASGQTPAYFNTVGLTGKEQSDLEYFNSHPTDTSYLDQYATPPAPTPINPFDQNDYGDL